jgi:hypothetical protein
MLVQTALLFYWRPKEAATAGEDEKRQTLVRKLLGRSKKGRFYNSPKELIGAPLHFGRYRRQSSQSNSRSKLLLDKFEL